MSAITNTPTNRNFLSPNNFRVVLQRAPLLNFFLQSASIPGLTFVGSIDMLNPFEKIPLPGDHLNYSPLSFSFMVDEDLTNYMEIWNWMYSIGGPTTLTPGTYGTNYRLDNSIKTDPNSTTRSDIKLMVMTSAKNPNIEVTFRDAFPISLGELSFNSTSGDVAYLESSVTFEYVNYTISRI